MVNIREGKKAPTFSLMDQAGKKHALKDYLGKWVLIYFYPKDNTSGCTKEACALRDSFPNFTKLKCVVLGISPDSETSHKKFSEKYALPFTLLADTEKVVAEKYGVWAEKKLMGKKYFGILRTSFLINPEGNVAKVYTTVKPETHAEEVIEDLKVLTKVKK